MSDAPFFVSERERERWGGTDVKAEQDENIPY